MTDDESYDLPDEDQTTVQETRANYCTSSNCRWLAWRLFAEGNFAWRPLSRAVNAEQHKDHPNCPEGPHTKEWARRSVDACGAAVAEAIDRDGPVVLAQYLQGLQSDLQAQLRLAAGAMQRVRVRRVDGSVTLETVEDNLLRSLARSRATDIRKLMAAALRITTDRRGMLLGQDPNAEPTRLVLEADTSLAVLDYHKQRADEADEAQAAPDDDDGNGPRDETDSPA